MAIKDFITPLTLASKASSTMGASYAALNGTGMAGAAFYIRLNNDTNQDVTVSYDGINDHEFLAAGQVLEIPVQTNAQPGNYRALFKKGTIVYVKSTAGTGTFYMSGFYQQN